MDSLDSGPVASSVPSKPSKREQNRSQQRERILNVARTLFATRGFDSVTVADIAQVAGVARATVFNYFSSKHSLVEAITEEVYAYYEGMLERALADEQTSTPDLVRALFEQMGAGIQLYQGFYQGVFREVAKLQVGLDEGGPASRVRERALACLEELLARGQERGELEAGFRSLDLAHAFDALSNGTINHWLYDDTSKPLAERMASAAEIFLGSVAHGPAVRSEPLPDLFPGWIAPPNPESEL